MSCEPDEGCKGWEREELVLEIGHLLYSRSARRGLGLSAPPLSAQLY
jgi:hypothetical protein